MVIGPPRGVVNLTADEDATIRKGQGGAHGHYNVWRGSTFPVR
jgi:hypothetical protein